MKTVLSLCDHSGVMVDPWLRNGFECWVVDIKHPPGETRHGNLIQVGADIHRWNPPRRDWGIVFAFPPCTNLAVSGARWFKEKGLRGLIDGLELVERCREICESSRCPWAIENPVSTLSTYWRKPDHIFNPCDFGGYLEPLGDAYTKKTCLWTGSGFRFPKPLPVEPLEGSRMHLLPPSEDRGAKRSLTPRGFAEAVFLANNTPALLTR